MSFLQSRDWERFQQALKRTTRRVDGTLFIQTETPIGHYWYAPRPARLEIDGLSRELGGMFLRVDPEQGAPVPQSTVSLKPMSSTQPHDSLIVPLQEAEALLASFHEKCRYNIRLAERKGVTVTSSNDPHSKELAGFLKLAQGTGQRQGFHYHPDSYYQAMFHTFAEGQLKLEVLTAWHEDQPAASLILLLDEAERIAYYLHGASDYAKRPLMAPHLLQFTAMQQAFAAQYQSYDLWGIAPVNDDRTLKDPDHSWAGITRFKLGFGGQVVSYPDSYDCVFSGLQYQLYTVLRRLRRSL